MISASQYESWHRCDVSIAARTRCRSSRMIRCLPRFATVVAGSFSATRVQWSAQFEDLHDLVAVVVDDFDGDAAGFRTVEGAGLGAIQRGPGVRIDFGLERRLESLVWVVAAGEVAMPDEERLVVVVGV